MIASSRQASVVIVATLWLLRPGPTQEQHRATELTETHREGRVVPAGAWNGPRSTDHEAVAPRFARWSEGRRATAAPSVRLCALCDSVLLFRSVTSSPSGRSELKGVEALVRVYDAILDARFDQAEAELQRACGVAPREACDVLAATATWWRILLDPDSRALDQQFSTQVELAIQSTEAWVGREPQNAEAHFYSGGAYGARVQWRVLRDEKLAAARDGKRIKQALERAIELDPDLDDAYFGIGLYQYYANVAPAAAKVLRFLLMLPGGNKTEGLARIQRARTQGKLLKGEADYQLQILYLWYERRADLAVELLESLHDRYPGNPMFTAQIADVQDRYQHDITASLATWRSQLAAAREQRVNEPDLAEAQARLGIARQLEALSQTDHALDQFRALLTANPPRPAGAMAAAYLGLGEGEDRLGHHDAAVAAYRLAISASPAPDPQAIRQRAANRMKRTPDPRRAEAYRLSLEGLRKLERADLAGAESLLARSIILDPKDGVARYRYGRVLQSKKENAAALVAYEAAIRSSRDCPPPIVAAAYLEAARMHERLSRRAQAIDYYRAASTVFGGGADTRAAANRALTRLRAAQ
jgi:tetratricopeptide (TPR) repeat protein